MRVSRVAFGCSAIGGHDYGKVDDADSLRAISAACASGITLFDTADIYGLGHSEQILAKGLGGYRNKVVVATKFGVCWDKISRSTYKDIRPVYLRTALKKSLKNLKLDCIPLYQVHWPDNITPLDDVLEELDKCRTAGLVRAFGLSNFNPIEHGPSISRNKAASIQLPYSLIDGAKRELLEYAASKLGLATLIYNVLAHGYLSGKYTRESVFSGTDLRTRDNSFVKGDKVLNWRAVDIVKQIALDTGLTPAQVVISWTLRQPFVGSVIIGAKTEVQVQQNAIAADINLDRAACQALGDVVALLRRQDT